MKEYMIDIETAHVDKGGLIFEVAAVEFTDVALHWYKGIFNYEESARKGFKLRASTLEWWESHGGVPRRYLKSPLSSVEILRELAEFLQGDKDVRIWSKGYMDVVMLEGYYEKYNIDVPWRYYQVRDLRTALEILGAEIRWEEVAHNALDDARDQAERLIDARKQKMKQ